MTNKLFSNTTDDAGARRILLLVGLHRQIVGPDFFASTLWSTFRRRGNSVQKDVFSFKETFFKVCEILLN